MDAPRGTVRRIDDLAMWRADTGAALGPVTFDAFGIGIGVDAADPRTVLAVVVDETDRESGATCFTDPDFIGQVLDAEDGSALNGPTLVEDLERVATIRAVSHFHTGLLDEGVVALDEAQAAALSGDMDAARGQYMMSGARLESLLETLSDSDGGKPIADELETMIIGCPAMDSERQVATIAAAVTDRRSEQWSDLLIQLVAEPMAAVAGDPEAAIPGVYLDLSVLPPRFTRFRGPDEFDLRINAVDDEIVEVSAYLRDEIIAESSDVDGLRVIAVEAETGAPISSARCAVRGLMVVAQLWLDTWKLDDVHFVMVSEQVPLSAVHADPFGVRLAQVDREVRFAWTQHRRAAAADALVSDTTDPEVAQGAWDLATLCRSSAKQWVDNACRALEDMRDFDFADNSGAVAIIVPYLEGVLRLVDAIDKVESVDGALRPTLAELCSEAGW